VGLLGLRAVWSSIYRSQGWPDKGRWSLVISLEFDSSSPQGEWVRPPCLAIYAARDVAGCEI